MAGRRMYVEHELMILAKQFRLKSGRTKAQLARELGVTRAAMQDAEEHPHKSVTKLRIRIIKACSPFDVGGPAYWLVRK